MLNLRTDARMAGRVFRYHTWPHIRPQTVAEHTWQVMRILVTIWPDVSRDVLLYVLQHDIGELRTGDLPYPIKADNKELQAIMDGLEDKAIEEICSTWHMPLPKDLPHLERQVFKLAEFIEMAEWGMEEALMGNKFAELVASRCWTVVEQRCQEWADINFLTSVDMDIRLWLARVVDRVRRYQKTRMEAWG